MGYMLLGAGGIIAAPLVLPMVVEGAVFVSPYIANGAVQTGRIAWGAAKTYHYSIGMNGGYFNLGMNYYNQSVATGDYGLKTKNVIGLVTSSFTTYNQSLKTQVILGTIGSGGLISITGEGNVETFLSTPWHYSATTTINGGLLQPYLGAFGSQLGLSNKFSGLIINSYSGGLQKGIEGTKKW